MLAAHFTDEYLTLHVLNHGDAGWRMGAAVVRWDGDRTAETWAHARPASLERPPV